MNLSFSFKALVTSVGLLSSALAFGQDVDPANLYTVTTEGSSSALKPGEKGKFVVAIKPKNGAHVSDEAPLKLEVSGKNAKPEKDKLVRADATQAKKPGEKYGEPRFEVPFTVVAEGKASLEGKLTFFICTEQICARQQQTLTLAVNGAGK